MLSLFKKPLKQDIFFGARVSSRYLRTLTSPQTEVVIGGNSVIFFTGASLSHHPLGMHSGLVFFNTGHWLDQLHPDYENLAWGQALWGLPRHVRRHFKRLFPTHHVDDKITFGQFKACRDAALEELQQSGVRVYSGIPEIRKSGEHYIVGLNGEPILSEKDILFYHSFRTPRTEHKLDDHLPKRSHVDLYYKPRSSVPRAVILIGGGRSSVWAAQNFPSTQFHCISQSPRLPLFAGESQPPNITFYPADHFVGESRVYDLASLPSKPEEARIIVTGSNGKQYHQGQFYCAIGMTQHPEITSAVSPEHLVFYPDKEWTEKWTAPTEIPNGSLMEATARWAAVTGNLTWAEEPSCFHGVMPDNFMCKLREHLEIPVIFYDLLRDHISHCETSLSDENCLQLYETCLEYAYQHSGIPFTAETAKTLKMYFEQGIEDIMAMGYGHQREIFDDNIKTDSEITDQKRRLC